MSRRTAFAKPFLDGRRHDPQWQQVVIFDQVALFRRSLEVKFLVAVRALIVQAVYAVMKVVLEFKQVRSPFILLLGLFVVL